jgi:LPXTG-motif cell wall-anchored protein
MNNKTMLIGLGVLAVAGIGYYMWKKKQEEEKKSNFTWEDVKRFAKKAWEPRGLEG